MNEAQQLDTNFSRQEQNLVLRSCDEDINNLPCNVCRGISNMADYRFIDW